MSVGSAREQALEFADRIAELGPIEIKRFFSGAGIVARGVQFAFVLGGTLYLRVDEESRAEFEALGAQPLTYRGATRRVNVASYYALSEALAEDSAALRRMAAHSLHAAAIAQSSKKARGRKIAGPASPKSRSGESA